MKIEILEETTKFPLQVMGKRAGVCWGAPLDDKEKNVKRAISCIKAGHGRVMELAVPLHVSKRPLDTYLRKVDLITIHHPRLKTIWVVNKCSQKVWEQFNKFTMVFLKKE